MLRKRFQTNVLYAASKDIAIIAVIILHLLQKYVKIEAKDYEILNMSQVISKPDMHMLKKVHISLCFSEV